MLRRWLKGPKGLLIPSQATISPQVGAEVYLSDTFTGSGALTAHTPDVCPVGSSWSVISGVFGDLSGGFVPYVSGTNGKAIINIGVSDFELTFRAKAIFTSTPQENGGIIFRSDATGADFYKFDFYALVNYTSGKPWTTFPNIVVSNLPTDLVHLTYYTFKIVCNGSQGRLYDTSGTLLHGSANLAKTSNNYVGLYTNQASNLNSWDTIQVTGLKTTWISFSIMGDSISDQTTEWPGIVSCQHRNGHTKSLNHSASGSSIAAHMDGQTNSCETDAADFTIIALGTNDGSDITAEYQENLQELFTTLGKPIYAMGVLPKSPSGTRDTINGYIQAAVTAAQGAGVNVTYWNTDGWIDPATDTSDGLHPNEAGHAKIATQVLARI